jgi:hypothetical protein
VGGAGLRWPRARPAPGTEIWSTTRSVIETLCAETGKAYEDALIAEILYGQAAFGFWAKMAPKYLADEKVRVRFGVRQGQEAARPLPAARSDRGDWAVELPLTISFGGLHTRAGGR